MEKNNRVLEQERSGIDEEIEAKDGQIYRVERELAVSSGRFAKFAK